MSVLAKLKSLGRNLKQELTALCLVLRHKRTPVLARVLLWLAIAYLVLPFDIIPDWVPVLGQIDDLIIVPALVLLALKMIPKEVIDECRAQARGGQREKL